MPSETFSHTATTAASRESVWKALDDPDTWNAISGVERVHQPVIDQEGRLRGFLFDTVVGGIPYEGRATPHAREEGWLMSWNITNSQITGQIRVELGEAQDGTLLTVTVDIASASFLAGMFFGAIAKVVGDGLPETVDTLAARLGLD